MNKNKTIRIFISSTFKDMHSERDHLVKFVFPELRERCIKKGLSLIDVDLRWGVTEEEAEQGKALEICPVVPNFPLCSRCAEFPNSAH